MFEPGSAWPHIVNNGGSIGRKSHIQQNPQSTEITHPIVIILIRIRQVKTVYARRDRADKIAAGLNTMKEQRDATFQRILPGAIYWIRTSGRLESTKPSASFLAPCGEHLSGCMVVGKISAADCLFVHPVASRRHGDGLPGPRLHTTTRSIQQSRCPRDSDTAGPAAQPWPRFSDTARPAASSWPRFSDPAEPTTQPRRSDG